MKTNGPNLSQALSYLDELSKHNDKSWFDKNRAAYDEARDSFERFIDGIIDARRVADSLQGLSAKECLTRINRDIRFSKDKSPYKTNLSASIAPGGRKSAKLGYHIAIGPHGNSLIAGGLYMPTPAQLSAFRQAVDHDASDLKKIISANAFAKYYGNIEGDKLATAPQGYSRTHPEIELLKLKQVLVVHRFGDQEVTGPGFSTGVASACGAMKPFLGYLNQLVGD